MKLIQLIQFVVVVSAFTVTLSAGQRFDEENDCCQLEWSPIIEAGHKRFIPADAVVAGRDLNGTNWYHIRKSTRQEAGIISDIVTKPALFYRHDDRVIIEDTWTGSVVLTNPNQCVLGWKLREKSYDKFDETMQYQFPRVKQRGFAYYPSTTADAAVSVGTSWEDEPSHYKYYGIQLQNRVWTQNSYGEKVLYVDCKASLLNQLQAELYDIDVDMKELLGSKKHQAVATTEVVNDGDVEQMANVDLTADISTAIEMKHDTQLRTVAETKWGVHGSLNLKFVENFFFVKASQEVNVNGGFDSRSLKENFTKDGTIRFDSTKTTYKFTQSVRMKPKSKTKIVINTRPIQGSQKFTAYYKLTPKMVNKKSWTVSRTLNTLQRIGFKDYNRVKTINNTLVLTYEGQIAVDTGFDTHVLIESRLLNETDSAVERTLIPFN